MINDYRLPTGGRRQPPPPRIEIDGSAAGSVAIAALLLWQLPVAGLMPYPWGQAYCATAAWFAHSMTRSGVSARTSSMSSTIFTGNGAALTALYAMLYALLKAEDYSLLGGSLLLFGLLAVVMIATRRIDWYELTKNRSLSGAQQA